VLQENTVWLAALREHPKHSALVHHWGLMEKILKVLSETDPDQRLVLDLDKNITEWGDHMKSNFGPQVVVQEFQGARLPHLTYECSQYDHNVIGHAIAQIKQFGNLLDYSSWFLEALNKEWKYYILHHACQGGIEAVGRSVDDQLLRRMCVRCSPDVRAAAALLLAASTKAPYMCKHCEVIKKNHFCKYKTHAYALEMCSQLVSELISDFTGDAAAWVKAL
jgi:hypothetical protein